MIYLGLSTISDINKLIAKQIKEWMETIILTHLYLIGVLEDHKICLYAYVNLLFYHHILSTMYCTNVIDLCHILSRS